MFNRRFLRVKILQALYAYFQDESPDKGQALKELRLSIEKTYDLLIFLLNLPLELHHLASLKAGDGEKSGKNPELNRFLENKVIEKLSTYSILQKLVLKRKADWSEAGAAMKRFFNQFLKSELYSSYCAKESTSYTEDRKFIVSIYKDLLPDFDMFMNAFHDRSIYWDDEDFDYAAYLAVSIIRKSTEDKPFGDLLKAVYSDADDKEFVEVLFRKTISNSTESEKLITARTKNWDVDRIALLDIILMKMAITEIMNFDQIPVKVSMNEYIDISKSFSSPQSGRFINGIIDKVVVDLTEQKKFKKVGRGLVG